MDVTTALSRLDVGHGQFPFSGDWLVINWMNTPGAIYGAETDTCGTGPPCAPNNVHLDDLGQEVVFRQPVNLYELRQVVDAATCDPFHGYGADGDLHWSYPTIKEWWTRRDELHATVEGWHTQQLHLQSEKNYDYFAGLCRWREYIETGLHDYLRVYAFFLEEHRIPNESDQLPDF